MVRLHLKLLSNFGVTLAQLLGYPRLFRHDPVDVLGPRLAYLASHDPPKLAYALSTIMSRNDEDFALFVAKQDPEHYIAFKVGGPGVVGWCRGRGGRAGFFSCSLPPCREWQGDPLAMCTFAKAIAAMSLFWPTLVLLSVGLNARCAEEVAQLIPKAGGPRPPKAGPCKRERGKEACDRADSRPVGLRLWSREKTILKRI